MSDETEVPAPDGLQRLWTPYRMAYVSGERDQDRDTPAGCPFCAMRDPRPDDLVVHRGDTVFAVLNLHPYNPGHLMVLPFRHVSDLEDLTDDEAAELGATTVAAVRTLRAVSAPDALNVGLNLGSAAGGSLSAHLHQHVVPRWVGDANFITVVGGTKTLPQLLEDTKRLLVESWSS